jgi:hypothetical protein
MESGKMTYAYPRCSVCDRILDTDSDMIMINEKMICAPCVINKYKDKVPTVIRDIPEPKPPLTIGSRDNIISSTYGEIYGYCVAEARKHFTDEATIASSSATLYIQANKDMAQMTGLKSIFNKKIQEGFPSLMAIYLWHYAPLISKFPKLGQAIRHWFKEMAVIEYKEMDERVKDYLYRNGYEDMNGMWMQAYADAYQADTVIEIAEGEGKQ